MIMKKIFSLLLGSLILFFSIGCSIQESSKDVNLSKNHVEKTDEVRKPAQDKKTSKDYTKQFDKVDLSLLKKENVINVKADASFASRCQTADEIYEKSPYIVRGIVKKRYFTALEGLPYTVLDFQVKDILKGNLDENSTVTVLLYGGYMTVQQHISYHKDASRFKDIKKNKWRSTYLKASLTGGDYPSEGEEYVLALMDSEISSGTYTSVNEFETIFKKTGDEFVRTLPADDYFGNTTEAKDSVFKNNKAFKYSWLENKCKLFHKMKKRAK